MSFDPKEFKKNSPFLQSNSTEIEDSRLERVNSAPPQSSACSLYEEQAPFSFVLTNDGTPIRIESSDESDSSEAFSCSTSVHQDQKTIEELENIKKLEESISQLSLLESEIKINNGLIENTVNTSNKSHVNSCSSNNPDVHFQNGNFPKDNESIPANNPISLNSNIKISQSINLDANNNKVSNSIEINSVLNAANQNFNNCHKVTNSFEKGHGDWEIEMESEGEEHSDAFSKFMSIEKLINEFSSPAHQSSMPSCPSSHSEDEDIPEIKQKLESLSIENDPSNNEIEDWDFEFESDENQTLSEFVKFMQIEKLTQQFPEIDTINVLDEILAILNLKERSPVEIHFINNKSKGFEKSSGETAASKMQILKNKVNTGIEKIRIEFNRATTANIGSVIENIKKIQIETVQEMKEIAAFVFEKIISEPIYFDVYLQIVGQLKEANWKCDEEMKMVDKIQTCFFGTLLSLAKRRFEAEHDWFASVDESTLSYSSRMDLEEQIEDRVADKIKKKEHALGTVNFLVSLYLKNITSLSNCQMVIDRLLSRNSAEHITMLCYIYKPLMEKLVHMNRTDLANRIVTYLKNNEKTCTDVRLQLIIEKALEYNPFSNKNNRPVKPVDNNSFAGMLSQESDTSPAKSDAEILQSYISDLVSAISGFSDDDEVLEYGDKIYRDVDRFNNSAFFTAYLIEMVSNYKYFKRMLDVLLQKLLPKLIDINEVMESLKDEMEMLSIDVACASKNYAELLCYLRSLNKLRPAEFNSFKLPQFLKNSSTLLKKWKENEDPRLSAVLTEEEIQKLNSF